MPRGQITELIIYTHSLTQGIYTCCSNNEMDGLERAAADVAYIYTAHTSLSHHHVHLMIRASLGAQLGVSAVAAYYIIIILILLCVYLRFDYTSVRFLVFPNSACSIIYIQILRLQ